MKNCGIYVHIPFCRQKCFYCDFPSFAGKERYMEAYTAALIRELEQRTDSAEKYRTIYIGGGTPTVLPSSLLVRILAALAPLRAAETEFTIEANPATVTAETLELLKKYGVNRISFGAQTFDDERLHRIGRIHCAQDVRDSVKLARGAGFANINIDLIYGLPGETAADVKADVAAALALGTEHISIYGLQVEDGTVFGKLKEQGKLELPDEEETEAMYDYITAELPRRGYGRYEISNFARAGFESRHNLGYWQDVPYIGLGAAAHSYIDGRRLNNVMDVGKYIEAIESGRLPLEEAEPATRENRLAEFCFLALRTAAGIDKAGFAERFGCDILSIYGEQIAKLKKQGLLAESEARLFLTERGMKYGNVAFAEFIL